MDRENSRKTDRAMLPGMAAALFCAVYCGFYTRGEQIPEKAAAGITVFFFLFMVNAAAVTDYRERRIPNRYCAWIVLAALAACFTMEEISLSERLLGGVVIGVPMFLLAVLVKGSFGGGDVKLMAACGLFLGWEKILFSFAAAIGLAALYSVILLMRGYGRKTQFPLGPFLGIGILFGIVAELF